MNAPFSWMFPTIAAVASGLAIGAGRDLTLAVPAAVVAVAAGGLTVVEALARRRAPSHPPPAVPANPRATLQQAFRGGAYGRELLVDLVDRIERAGPHPELPGRSIEATRALAALSPDEFRRYLRDRVDQLEGSE